MSPFDPKTAFFVAGLLYLVMPLTVWSILWRRHDAANVRYWCLGGLSFGLGLILVGLRTSVPDWLSIGLANPLTFASYAFRIVVLNRELGAPSRSIAVGVIWGAVSLAFLAIFRLSDLDAPRILLSNMAHLAGAGVLMVLAWRLHRRRRSASAAMLAAAYGAFAIALIVRVASVFARGSNAVALAVSADFAALFVTAILAALYGNLGYLGMALETISGRERQRAAELASEQARRQEAERFNKEQAALLEERTQLLSFRSEMLATLAHEVRQPLNNASAAIESAGAVLQAGGSLDVGAATHRLQRARTVLTRVANSVDNTLTDAALLGGEGQLFVADGDIDTLIQLALADIDKSDVRRVNIVRDTTTRTVPFNQGLMRLALRNLLLNALAYAHPGSQITIRVSDSDQPLALILDVCDEGPGVPPDLATTVFDRGVRGNGALHGHGIGLHIVRSVMRLHGGEATLHSNSPDGACFRLVLPVVDAGPG